MAEINPAVEDAVAGNLRRSLGEESILEERRKEHEENLKEIKDGLRDLEVHIVGLRQFLDGSDRYDLDGQRK